MAEILGAPRFENEVAMRVERAGRGDRARLDAGRRRHPVHRGEPRARAPGGLILTGQLGDVMKESAQAAVSLVKAQSETLGLDPALFEKSDIHIHVPGGRDPEGRPERGRRACSRRWSRC